MSNEEHSHALPKGSILLEYKILSILGEGGFGITYKALDTISDKIVAIKEYMPSQFASRSQDNVTISFISKEKEMFEWGLKRFIEEAKLLQQLHHINIIKVEKFFRCNKTAYLVMEYYEGETLEKYLKKNRGLEFDRDEIVYHIMPIIEGLKAVHKKGFLHRDIAPDNIYLRKNNSSVLIDFGASRNALGIQSLPISAIVKQGYSPIEQYSLNSKQNETTDLYAVSAVIYEMITGKRPSEATYRQTEMFDDNPDPLEDITSSYQDRFELLFLQTITKGLEIRQKDRIQTIQEFQEGLVKEDKVERDNNNALHIGYMLQKYKILEVLGSRGFITYKVLDTNLDKIMVIREYMPWNLSTERFQIGLNIFTKEAKELLKYNHTNITRVLQVFEANNTAYIVMEYYEGETLESYLDKNKNKKFTQNEILSIIRPILKGLEVVHKTSILHLNIAPDNIFLPIKEEAILIGFSEGLIAIETYELDTRINPLGVKIGYSSPKRHNSTSKITQSTDIYSISAVIYKMITGNIPPESNHRQTALFNEEDDPIEDIVSKYSDRFSIPFLETVARGLDIRQKNRIQNIEEFQEGLVKINNEQDIWTKTVLLGTKEAFSKYLIEYPNGKYKKLANKELKDIEEKTYSYVKEFKEKLTKKEEKKDSNNGLKIIIGLLVIFIFTIILKI